MKKWRLLLYLRELVVSLTSGRHASRKSSSFGLEVRGMHRFGLGDDISSLDFSRYVLSGEEYSIERMTKRTARIYFFLDRSASGKVGWHGRTGLEAQAALVDLFISGLADEGNHIGIGGFTDTVEFVPVLKSGRRALRSELENVLEKRYRGIGTDFSELHEFLFAEIPRGALIFVISDWESPTLTGEIVSDVDGGFELIPIALLHKYEEKCGFLLGDMSVSDPETGETVAARAVVNDHKYRKVFEEAGVDALELFIEDDEEEWKSAIEEFFEERKKRKRERRQTR